MFARIVEENDALNCREPQRTGERKRNRNDLSKGNEKEGAEGVVRCALARVCRIWCVTAAARLAQSGKYQVSSKRESISRYKPPRALI